MNDDDVTAISALVGEGDTTITAIYTVDGKQVGDLQQGLNIEKSSRRYGRTNGCNTKCERLLSVLEYGVVLGINVFVIVEHAPTPELL